MNRRAFLTRLGLATASAAAVAALDPEQLLWVPGAKTIIDLGATKPIVPATDAEVLALHDTGNGFKDAEYWYKQQRYASKENPLDDYANRHIRVDVRERGGQIVSAYYKGDKLISRHTPEELRLLEKPLFGNLDHRHMYWRRPAHETDFSLIDVPEDYE